ncbi:MAG: glutamate-ammonia-ligase adenylyltransferase [Granulosicoccus sp.]|jgi:glutamate-ammonia-ligase adenylyltransferase
MQCDISKDLLTPVLLQRVSDIEKSLARGTAAHALIATWLKPLCAVSPYLEKVARQYPEAIDRLILNGDLTGSCERPSHTQWAAELQVDLNAVLAENKLATLDSRELESLQQRVLRQFRHRKMFRILWRDLTGVANVYDTLHELSTLADACVIVADEWTYTSLIKRYGIPRNADGDEQRLIVLGMGKLGGYELNVSSDIDLICLWPDAGKTDGDTSGRRVVDASEFFRRSVQLFTRLLNSTTVDGFAFRVDTRLRPFGDSGPLVMNFDGLENYYLTQARDWERYAMIKARAITGNEGEIDILMGLVTPFVYRRYLDYNAFDSLRDLKRKIALSVNRKGLVDNIKLGSGGIREIEFVGQSFQLVRGGRDDRLRMRSIVQVLKQLAKDSLLAQRESESLLEAYTYLRRVENAIQMMRDEQRHSLPVDETDQLRLIAMLDETDWESFRRTLSHHQDAVSQIFMGLFEVENATECVDDISLEDNTDGQSRSDLLTQMSEAWTVFSLNDIGDDVRSQRLEALGFATSDELLSVIATISHGAFYLRLTNDSQDRVARIAPLIMSLSAKTSEPSQTLIRCMALVRAVAGRSGYLQVLCDQPQALSRLVSMFSQSRWLANFVSRQPMVIDELLEGPSAEIFLNASQVAERTQAQLERIRSAELDVQMDSLRHYRQGSEMRIACAQLDGSLTLMQVSDQLSWLAESIIDAVVQLIEAPLKAKYGQPCFEVDGKRRISTEAIIAYGKLGGLELGFASDLDLVFVHDSGGEKQWTDGAKSVDNSVYYARLAQKFVHFMGTMTPAGVLYEIDLRLRPNGTSGVLVSGIDAFAQYQNGDAWTWEHQALIRARMVFGRARLRSRFDDIRAQVLAQDRSESELREAVANMRERMRTALGNSREDQFHLKQDAGGVADIEFIVQFLVLAYSAENPALLEYTDNIRILDTVESLSLVPANETATLRDSYLALREYLHRQALQEGPSVVPMDNSLKILRESVIAIKQRILGSSQVDLFNS